MSKLVAICSSMQFRKEIIEAAAFLESQGWTVLTPELSEKSSSYVELSLTEQQTAKRSFIKNHFERIGQSQAILVLNYEKKGIGGYVGSNTLMEIGVACSLGKAVYILNALAEQGCKEEVDALATKILNGDLRVIV